LLQSVQQFGVFGTELVDQRIGLFAERLDRLGIGLLLGRFDLIVEEIECLRGGENVTPLAVYLGNFQG
jgi:hypothetical protein